jgi:hypothetical protein
VLLDDLMPVYDVAERHRTIVHAAPEVVFSAIRSADLSGGVTTRALLIARAAPAAFVAFMRSPRTALTDVRARLAQRRGGLRLATFERAGFAIVDERAPDELVIGLLGRFWTPGGALCAGVSARDLTDAPPEGYAVAGWNFTVTRRADGTTELRTETRVRCAADARAKFRAYWTVVRPGSGLIRRRMLRAIRCEAERMARR